MGVTDPKIEKCQDQKECVGCGNTIYYGDEMYSWPLPKPVGEFLCVLCGKEVARLARERIDDIMSGSDAIRRHFEDK